MICDIMIQQYIYLQLFFIIFKKNQINFFLKICYVNFLKCTKRLKFDHEKEK